MPLNIEQSLIAGYFCMSMVHGPSVTSLELSNNEPGPGESTRCRFNSGQLSVMIY
jgi:hypothetical protein